MPEGGKSYFDLALSAAGKTRKYKVSPGFTKNLNAALAETGKGITAEITSGGQMSLAEAKRIGAVKKGSGWYKLAGKVGSEKVPDSKSIVIKGVRYKLGEKVRTGSTRHDVDASGMSQTADVVLKRDGKVVKPMEDKALYKSFIQNAAKRFPGIGHYSWGVHVGGGSEAFWGPSTTDRDADPDFKNAFIAGRAGKTAADIVADSKFEETPPKDAGPIGAVAALIGNQKEAMQGAMDRTIDDFSNLPFVQDIGNLLGISKRDQTATAGTGGAVEEDRAGSIGSLLRPSLNDKGESEVDTSQQSGSLLDSISGSDMGTGPSFSDGEALLAGIGQLFSTFGQGGGDSGGAETSHRGLARALKRPAMGLTTVGSLMSRVRVR